MKLSHYKNIISLIRFLFHTIMSKNNNFSFKLSNWATNWVKLLKYQKAKVTNLMTQHIINCTHISFAFIISFSFSFWSHVNISFWYLLYFIFSSSKKCKVFLSYQNDFLIYSVLQSTFFKNNFFCNQSLWNQLQ